MTQDRQNEIKQLIVKLNELIKETPHADNDLFLLISTYLKGYTEREIEMEYWRISKFISLETFTAEQIAQLIRYGQSQFVHGRLEGRADILADALTNDIKKRKHGSK